jgi:uncharacterized protein YxjI
MRRRLGRQAPSFSHQEVITMLNYPLDLRFKVLAALPQVKVSDAAGQVVMYVKEKLALKTAVRVFADEAQQRQVYAIAADKMMGLTITYHITTAEGGPVGALKRLGMKSIWKANYPILDAAGAEAGNIHEENPWIKVLDGLLGEIPGVGMYINPAYLVDLRGQTVLRIKKQPSIMEGKFLVEKKADLSEADEKLLLPAIIMFIMLERARG